MQPDPIRVVIVDDYDLLRRGLAVFLQSQPGFELVGEADNGYDAVKVCGELHPDVVLIDLIMPGMDGVATIQKIVEKYPEIKCIVLTSFSDEALVQRALNVGAISYLLKDVSIDELGKAIRKAHLGQSTISQEAVQALVHAAHSPAKLDNRLTTRERQVLKCMVKGMSNSDIADDLSITVSTVKKHVSNILAKFRVTSRTEMVALAIRERIVKTREDDVDAKRSATGSKIGASSA